jgi:hypothetical protein
MKRFIIKVLSVFITVALVALLVSRTSFGDIAATLKSIRPAYLAIGFLLYMMSYLLRTMRYTALLNKKIEFRDMFKVVCVHNAANNIMPARTGELSYMYLIKKWYNVPLNDGTASLIVARVLDYMTISLLFFISLGIEKFPGISIWIIWAILAFLGLLFIMLLLMVFYKNFINLPGNIFRRIGLGNNRAAKYLLEKSNSLIMSLQSMSSHHTMFVSFLISIAIWIVIVLMYWMLGTGMNLSLSFTEMIVATTFFVLATVLPVSGIGGFGTSETGWVIGLVLMGIPLKSSINMGFSLHIIILIFSIIIGMVSIKKLLRVFNSDNNPV